MLSANSSDRIAISGRDHDPDERVHRQRATGRDQDRDAATPPIGQRAVEQEREAVRQRADKLDRPEVLLTDAADVLEDRHVVAAHIKEGVGQPER